MKKQTLTILLLLFLGSNCIGQKKDSIVDLKFQGWIVNHDKYDSIKVIMLVCDTSWANYLKVDETTGVVTKIGGSIIWQFGYEVYENYFVPAHEERQGDGIIIHQDEWRKRFVARLDQNKKRLNQSIVVWITKEIK